MKCKKVKVSYDPISNVSLPMPNSNTVLLSILVFALPIKWEQQLKGLGFEESAFETSS